jgi:hypothetical protein
MRAGVLLGLAVLVVCSTVAPVAGAPASSAAADDGEAPQRADPDVDAVGWEGGYWHDERIDVDQSDGLSEAELDAYVSRAMARVEYIRDAEFDGDVPVEVVSRAAYRRSSGNESGDTAYAAWNDQVWEALFVVGENRSANEVIRSTSGQSVVGFYAPDDDRIRIITDSPDRPTIDNGTLVHELVHALQDQRGDLGENLRGATTQDGQLAVDGVVEGEANYVERRYAQRCGVEWDCVETPASSGGAGPSPNLGVLLTLLQPYSDGPVYVDWLRERGGWDAVDAAFDDPPTSSEQVIHLTDDQPTPIEYEDRARGGWETFPNQGEDGSDTVGEASMYVMFWYQARTAEADTIPVRSLARTSGPLDTYNYESEPSAGWGNDRLFPYRQEGGEETRYGYVWVTEWDSRADASEFVSAYRAILDAHDATRENGTHVVPSGDFADAFRIDRDGRRVTVVNGPTPEAVDDIRPGGAAGGASGDGESDGPSVVEFHGFGAAMAVVTVLVAAALAAVRRRE